MRGVVHGILRVFFAELLRSAAKQSNWGFTAETTDQRLISARPFGLATAVLRPSQRKEVGVTVLDKMSCEQFPALIGTQPGENAVQQASQRQRGDLDDSHGKAKFLQVGEEFFVTADFAEFLTPIKQRKPAKVVAPLVIKGAEFASPMDDPEPRAVHANPLPRQADVDGI